MTLDGDFGAIASVVVSRSGDPEPHELQKLGVARMTWGSGLASLAYAKAAQVAGGALA